MVEQKKPPNLLSRCLLGLSCTAVPPHWRLALMPHKSNQEKIAFERRLRGRGEARKLHHADWAVVSWGKSGRTWLRAMVSHYCKAKFNIRGDFILGFSNYYVQNGQAPKVLFTHDNYLRDYTKNTDNLLDYAKKRIIFLARDPRDTVVSQYFQWRYRMKLRKKNINQYPSEGTELFDFMLDEKQGLPRVIAFMNHWAAGLSDLQNFLLIRYEDLRLDPSKALTELTEFTGMQGTASDIAAAVEYAKFENMKKRESNAGRLASLTNSRLSAADVSNPDSYKTRKGKVGGFVDYFDAEQIATINQMMTSLSSVYGYQPDLGNQPSV